MAKTTKKPTKPRSTSKKAKAEAGVEAKPAAEAPRSYLVLARRYRPTQFEQVIGQEHVTRTLQNAIQASRVHHAYLFTGCRGVGKTTVARIMSKALNCDEGPTPSPCDRCPSCEEIRDGRAVDVFEIDGASHTGVDDVRELRESVRYAPTRNRHKIYIIDEVHMLSTSAFNALLKTLEEPPPHVVFIFATTEPHKIPATILSRCQRFDFKRVPAPTLVRHLAEMCSRESVRVAQDGLSLIARAAEGSVRDSLSLLDQVIAYHAGEEEITVDKVAEVLGVADRRVLFELSAAILGRDAQTALSVVDRLFESGQDLSQFAQAFLSHLRNLTVARTCADPGPLVDATEAELAELRRQAEGEGGELLPQHFDHFARVTEEVARSSLPRLLLEMAAIEMVNAQPLLPLGDLLERLERMEARVGSAGGGFPAAGGGPPRFPGSGSGPEPKRTRSHRTQGSAGAGSAAPSTPIGQGSAGAGSAAPSTPIGQGSAGAGSAAPSTPIGQGSAGAGSAAPSTPKPKTPGNGQNNIEGWQHLLEGAMQREPVAAAAFAAGKLVSWSGDTVVLGYPSDSFELQWAKDPQKLSAFEAVCSQQARRQLRIEIRELSADEQASPEVMKASAFQERERRKADHQRTLLEEARGHPVTRMFVETFGAKIDAITTEADDS
jgi:DNA polymerase-3 subunit gamma/tau